MWNNFSASVIEEVSNIDDTFVALYKNKLSPLDGDKMEKLIPGVKVDEFTQKVMTLLPILSAQIKEFESLVEFSSGLRKKEAEKDLFLLQQKKKVLDGLFQGSMIDILPAEYFGKHIVVREEWTLAARPTRDENGLIIIGA